MGVSHMYIVLFIHEGRQLREGQKIERMSFSDGSFALILTAISFRITGVCTKFDRAPILQVNSQIAVNHILPIRSYLFRLKSDLSGDMPSL